MPTYQYSCSKCGHEFEVFQSMKDASLEVCPKDKCGQPRWGRGKVKRLLGTGAGLIFKGSGFYITDYRSENYKAAAQKDASASSPSTASSSAGKTESGTASKTTGTSSSSTKSKPKPV